MKKLRRLGPTLVMMPILASILLVGFWLFLDEPLFPADVITGRAWAAPPITHPGETITMNYTLDTRRGCPRVFKSWLTNGIITTFQEFPGHQTEPAGPRVLSYKVRLPDNIELGMHVYHAQGLWKCNPLVDQVVDYPAIKFEVIQ